MDTLEADVVSLQQMTGMEADVCREVLLNSNGNIETALEVLLPSGVMEGLEAAFDSEGEQQATEQDIEGPSPSNNMEYQPPNDSDNLVGDDGNADDDFMRRFQQQQLQRQQLEQEEHEDEQPIQMPFQGYSRRSVPPRQFQTYQPPSTVSDEWRASKEDEDLARAIEASMQIHASGAPATQQQQQQQGVVAPAVEDDVIVDFQIRHGDEVHELSIGRDASVGELKAILQALTGMELHRQIVEGWPIRAARNDGEQIARLLPDHVEDVVPLLLREEPPVPEPISSRTRSNRSSSANSYSNASNSNSNNNDASDDDARRLSSSGRRRSNVTDTSSTFNDEDFTDEDSEYDSDDEDVLDAYLDNSHLDVSRGGGPLVQTGLVEHPSLAPDQFGIAFSERYGDKGPLFFPESLSRLLEIGLEMKRPVVVYLHSDNVVERNVFVSQVLQNDEYLDLVGNEAISWGWDMTGNTHQLLFSRIIRDFCGRLLNELPRTYPSLVVLAMSGASTTVAHTIEGFREVEQVLAELQRAFAIAQGHIHDYYEQKRQAKERQRLREEQDLAFEESQKADLAKAKEREKEAEAKRMEEEAKLLELERIAAEEKAAEERAAQEQENAKNMIPEEPAANADDIATLQIRAPTGTRMSRRFLRSHTVQNIVDFCCSEGFSPSSFDLVIPHPRKVLSDSSTSTLAEVGLGKRELLLLEAKDSES